MNVKISRMCENEVEQENIPECVKKEALESLSKWPPQANTLPHAHHGEKSPATNLDNLLNLYGSNLVMEKQYLEMDMDPSTLLCVNPYEVNPIIMEKTMLPTPTLSVDVPLKGDTSATHPRNWDTSCGGGFYAPRRKVKLEMEEFSDLSPFVLPKPMSANSVDELNTPIFDKDAFDFNVNIYQKDRHPEESFVKLECDAYYGNNCIITDNNQFKNFSISTEKVHRNGNVNSDVGNNTMLQCSDINVFSPQSENGSAYNSNISPSYENTNTALFNVDDNSALSVKSNKQFSNISSSNEVFQRFKNILETPEDSNSSTSIESTKRPSKLLLNINLKPTPSQAYLSTPSIIDEVVDLESSSFNILDLVANEDITYVSSEDIFAAPSSAKSLCPQDVKPAVVQNNEYIPEKRPRKRRLRTDDDEDYIPPTKRNIMQRKNIIQEDSDSESNSDVDIESKPKTKTRGRPPKRTESVSSDCSKDSDASKYRELRDKNNEASRKSRLKRKIKELELEKEAEELISKNIKLKAHVEELEKMVTNFRDNLFKIMIKK